MNKRLFFLFVCIVSDARPITANELKRLREDNITLVFMSYHLKDFINKPISDQV